MKSRFCPNCGTELDSLGGQLTICPNCKLMYSVNNDDQLIRFDIEPDDEEIETNTPTQPQKQVEQQTVIDTESQPKQNKDFSQKSNALTKKALIILCVCAIVAAVLVVVSFLVKFDFAAVLLILCGVAMLILGIVLWATLPKKARKICPCCGTKREHHRRWVNTTSKTVNVNQGQKYTIKYTHHYIDTYTCPHCGETAEYKVTGSGGEKRISDQYGYEDKRTEPIEF